MLVPARVATNAVIRGEAIVLTGDEEDFVGWEYAMKVPGKPVIELAYTMPRFAPHPGEAPLLLGEVPVHKCIEGEREIIRLCLQHSPDFPHVNSYALPASSVRPGSYLAADAVIFFGVWLGHSAIQQDGDNGILLQIPG